MEMKNNMNSPRDRIDDELLVRLLNESEPFTGQYGSSGMSSRRNSSSCRCRRTQMNVNPSVQSRREEIPADKGNDDCGSQKDEDCAKNNAISGWHLAMSYTPDQEWRNLIDVEEALHHGTIFSELEFPFYPACGRCR